MSKIRPSQLQQAGATDGQALLWDDGEWRPGDTDAAGTAAAAVAAHSLDTTAVHGITDTADLILEGDARLTDDRDPTAHAATHAAGGGDEVTLTQAQITGLASALAAKLATADLASSVLSLALTDFPAGLARDSEVSAAVAALVASAPGTLDTLDELAAAIGDDPNFATTLATSLAAKVDKATFDANTILKADTDNTPSALTVAASTLVGRGSSGGIAALTPSQVKTLLAIAAADIADGTATGQALITAASAAAARSTLGLVLGTDIYSKTGADAAFQPISAGVLLASTIYCPATGVDSAVTSVFNVGGYVDIDATNLAITFTVPPSGAVVIEAETSAAINSSANTLFFALRDGSTTLTNSAQIASSATTVFRVPYSMKITGLTPGATKTYKLAYAVTAGTGHVYYGGGNSTPNGPVVMKAWAA